MSETCFPKPLGPLIWMPPAPPKKPENAFAKVKEFRILRTRNSQGGVMPNSRGPSQTQGNSDMPGWQEYWDCVEAATLIIIPHILQCLWLVKYLYVHDLIKSSQQLVYGDKAGCHYANVIREENVWCG